MKIYRFKNGDRCPCCGETLRGKSGKELEEFSVTVFRTAMWLNIPGWVIPPKDDAIELSHEELMQKGEPYD